MATSPPQENPARPGRKRKTLRLVLLALLILPLLIVGLLLLALRSGSARQALISRVSQSLEESTGLRARAGDFSLDITASVLELYDVTLATGDALPFLTAERARVDFEWRQLFAEPRILQSVAVEAPVVDLRQPQPPPSAEPPPRIDVLALRLADGRLLGPVPAGDGEPWLREWSAGGVGIAGSYVGGRVDLRLDGASLRLVRVADGPLDLELESRLAGPLEGPYVVDSLKLVGDGLRLDAAGEIGTGPQDPLTIRLDLDADPSLLATDLGAGGRLRAAGEIDLRRFRGDLRLAAEDFPAQALEPWIGEAARPGGKPSWIDLDGRFTSDPDAAQQITGDAELVWRQGERRLATASATLADGRLDADGVVLASLIGDVHATVSDLPAEFLRPWLGADNLDRLAAKGTRVDLDADFTVDAAAPSDPRGHVDVVWRRGRERLLEAAARTAGDSAAPLGGSGGENTAATELDFQATLLPAAAGRRHVGGRLTAPSWPELASGTLSATRFELALPDLAAALADARGRWPRLFDDAGFDPAAAPLQLAGALEVTADVAGPIPRPTVSLDARWQLDESSSLAVVASGEPLARRGEARLTVESFDLARLAGEAAGRLTGVVTASGSPQQWQAAVDADGTDLRYGTEMPAFEELHLAGRTDGAGVELTALAGRTGESTFRGDGRFELAAPLAEVDLAEARIAAGALRLAAEAPFTGVDSLDLEAELSAGVLHVSRLDIEAITGPGNLVAEIPLGALRALEIDVDAWPVETAEGRIKVDLGFPSLDFTSLARDVGVEELPWTTHQASLTGRLWIDPADLTAAEGELLVERWLLEVGDHRLELVDDVILLAVAGRLLDIVPVTVQADGNPVDVDGTVELATKWKLGDGFAGLVKGLSARAEGVVEGALLTPYLAGGVAAGPIAVVADVSGSIDRLGGKVTLDGPAAKVLYPTPYLTQIAAPRAEIFLEGDVIRIHGAQARLNEGTLAVDGLRDEKGDWTFYARFDDVRYRLDYGLTARLVGDLEIDLPAGERGRIAGEIEVQRAVLRRNLDLDREILNVLFAPPDVSGAEADPLDEIDLDITVTTVEGVRVKNNLADLRANWSPLTVQGTAADPIVQGEIEVDSGGFLYVYGQTARIDQGALVWTGATGLLPEVKLETTSTLEDPTIAAPGRELSMTWQSPSEGQGRANLDQVLAEGLAGYYGGRVASRLGATRIQVQPLLVFGETDPGANLVISRDLSAWVALAVAIDLRDSQNQTYLIELHNLRRIPRLAFQVFTSAEGREVVTEDGDVVSEDNEGVTVQQTISFGKGKSEEDVRRLGSIVFEALPETVSAKALRRAISFGRRDPLGEGADFEVEVDLAEHLRRRGFPGAEVNVEVEPAGRHTDDLRVAVEPGPLVVFTFAGDKPPAALRRSITEPYRLDFYEQASLEDVRKQTVRALRSQGFLEPRVEVAVEVASDGTRTVTVRSEGGRKARLDDLVFAGIGDDEAAYLGERFTSPVARVELAAAVPEADEWLLRNLRSLGYAAPRIVSRRLSENGRRLTVELVAGPRQGLAEISVRGLSEADAADYLEKLPVRRGDPPRAQRLAAGNLLILNDLKRRGYGEARVRTRLVPVDEDCAGVCTDLVLAYEVEPGPQYRLDAIGFEGLRATRPKWARHITELEESSTLDPGELGKARRRLSGTRLFESVRTVTDRSPDGAASVTFEVDERPRFQLSYGLRWVNVEGLGLVADLVDRNFLGRGITVGVRGLYSDQDQAGRFYVRRSGIFGRRTILEFFLEQRHKEENVPVAPLFPGEEVIDNSFLTDTLQGTVQLSFPLGKLSSRVYGSFKREHIREKPPFLDPLFPFDQVVRFPFVGWQVIYDTRDDLVSPRRGLFASADLSASSDVVGSDFNFVRLFTQLQWMRPVVRLGSGQLIWAQSYRLGLFETSDRFPLNSELFQAGGEFSVRGYRTDSLFELGAAGGGFFPPKGGQALLVINQELRFPVWREVAGVVFLDFGNAWFEKNDFGSDLARSVGLGLRADTPFGLIRFDAGYPLDRREGDPSFKTYLGFGHAF